MKARVGDWLVIKGMTIDQPDQQGLITEVHSADGSPPYVVRWLETDHVAADERAQHRFGAVQSAIQHGNSE